VSVGVGIPPEVVILDQTPLLNATENIDLISTYNHLLPSSVWHSTSISFNQPQFSVYVQPIAGSLNVSWTTLRGEGHVNKIPLSENIEVRLTRNLGQR